MHEYCNAACNKHLTSCNILYNNNVFYIVFLYSEIFRCIDMHVPSNIRIHARKSKAIPKLVVFYMQL